MGDLAAAGSLLTQMMREADGLPAPDACSYNTVRLGLGLGLGLDACSYNTVTLTLTLALTLTLTLTQAWKKRCDASHGR